MFPTWVRDTARQLPDGGDLWVVWDEAGGVRQLQIHRAGRHSWKLTDQWLGLRNGAWVQEPGTPFDGALDDPLGSPAGWDDVLAHGGVWSVRGDPRRDWLAPSAVAELLQELLPHRCVVVHGGVPGHRQRLQVRRTDLGFEGLRVMDGSDGPWRGDYHQEDALGEYTLAALVEAVAALPDLCEVSFGSSGRAF